MSQGKQYQITGDKEIQKILRGLPDALTRKAVRTGLRDAAKKMSQGVKQKAPVDTGTLKAAVKVKAGKRKKGRISMDVVIDTKADASAFYGAMVEFGAKEGRLKAHHYMESAFDEGAPDALKSLMDQLIDGINKAISQGKKK